MSVSRDKFLNILQKFKPDFDKYKHFVNQNHQLLTFMVYFGFISTTLSFRMFGPDDKTIIYMVIAGQLLLLRLYKIALFDSSIQFNKIEKFEEYLKITEDQTIGQAYVCRSLMFSIFPTQRELITKLFAEIKIN